jgi:cell wall-associated NlpC family hydrolase
MPFSGLSLAVPNPENIIQPPSEDPFSGENPQATDDQNQSNLTIQQKQELANKIQAELDQLETEIENQIEDYNAEQVKLNDIQNKLTEASQAFDEINAQYGEKQDIYEKRITEIYKNGSSSLLEVLLSTQSFTDFISRVRFLALIAHRDSSMVDTLMKERTLLRTARDELEQLKQQQEEVMTKLQSKKAEIQAKIAEKSKILSSVEIDIQQIIDEQTKTKAEEQKKLLDELKMKAQSGLTSLTAMLDPSSVISTTLQYLGIRYQWGGEKPETGFDCSGLVLYVFRQHGVIVPHYSGWQFKMGTTVGLSELQPGDLVFFGSPIHHVGIYMGDFNGGKYMIHAPKTGDIIKISDFSTRKDFAGAKRFPLLPRE